MKVSLGLLVLALSLSLAAVPSSALRNITLVEASPPLIPQTQSQLPPPTIVTAEKQESVAHAFKPKKPKRFDMVKAAQKQVRAAMNKVRPKIRVVPKVPKTSRAFFAEMLRYYPMLKLSQGALTNETYDAIRLADRITQIKRVIRTPEGVQAVLAATGKYPKQICIVAIGAPAINANVLNSSNSLVHMELKSYAGNKTIGEVQREVRTSYLQIRREIMEALVHRWTHRRCGSGAYFTGFGVGGAVASLAALDLVASQPKLLPKAGYLSSRTSSFIRVVTFGEPRSLSVRTAKRAQNRIPKIRYLHFNDTNTNVPSWKLDYNHWGYGRFINRRRVCVAWDENKIGRNKCVQERDDIFGENQKSTFAATFVKPRPVDPNLPPQPDVDFSSVEAYRQAYDSLYALNPPPPKKVPIPKKKKPMPTVVREQSTGGNAAVIPKPKEAQAQSPSQTPPSTQQQGQTHAQGQTQVQTQSQGQSSNGQTVQQNAASNFKLGLLSESLGSKGVAQFSNVLEGVESSLSRLISGGELNDDLQKSLRDRHIDGYSSPVDTMSPWLAEEEEEKEANKETYGGLTEEAGAQSPTDFMSAGIGSVGSAPLVDKAERAKLEKWIYGGNKKLKV